MVARGEVLRRLHDFRPYAASFIGVENYRTLTHDKCFWNALHFTVYVYHRGNNGGFAIAFPLALYVATPRPFIAGYRMAFFLSVVVGFASAYHRANPAPSIKNSCHYRYLCQPVQQDDGTLSSVSGQCIFCGHGRYCDRVWRCGVVTLSARATVAASVGWEGNLYRPALPERDHRGDPFPYKTFTLRQSLLRFAIY